jgi:hypothetical protein
MQHIPEEVQRQDTLLELEEDTQLVEVGSQRQDTLLELEEDTPLEAVLNNMQLEDFQEEGIQRNPLEADIAVGYMGPLLADSLIKNDEKILQMFVVLKCDRSVVTTTQNKLHGLLMHFTLFRDFFKYTDWGFQSE